MSGYSGLTWNERILRCCELAEGARLRAEAATAIHARERYLTIAGQWMGLALDIERRHRDVKVAVSQRPRGQEKSRPTSKQRALCVTAPEEI